jgi:hypothetical protein
LLRVLLLLLVLLPHRHWLTHLLLVSHNRLADPHNRLSDSHAGLHLSHGRLSNARLHTGLYHTRLGLWHWLLSFGSGVVRILAHIVGLYKLF